MGTGGGSCILIGTNDYYSDERFRDYTLINLKQLSTKSL
jgi:hypothetical protein